MRIQIEFPAAVIMNTNRDVLGVRSSMIRRTTNMIKKRMIYTCPTANVRKGTIPVAQSTIKKTVSP
jgi:hypothetical protein